MKKTNEVEVTVSNQTVIRVIALVVATLIGFQLLRSFALALQLIFIAFFLSLALNPAVSWFSRKLKLKSRISATAISYILVVVSVGSLIAYVVPPLVSQTAGFISNVPQTLENLQRNDSPLSGIIERYNLEQQIDGLADDLRERTGDFSQPVIATAGRVGGAIVSLITVLVLTFMMLVEGPRWIKRYMSLIPQARRKHQTYLAQKMYGVVTGYVNGQVLLSVIGATSAFIVLAIVSTLLGVSINAVALAGILVFTGLIPMIGNTIGGVILVVSCLFVSLPLAIIMGVFFTLYQQIENVTLQPYIQSKYNEVTPLLVFVSALLGISAGGFIGALIAIPVAGCLKILFLDYLSRRKTTAE